MTMTMKTLNAKIEETGRKLAEVIRRGECGLALTRAHRLHNRLWNIRAERLNAR